MQKEHLEFEFDDEGYHLTCHLTNKQLIITVQNYADNTRDYCFREILTQQSLKEKKDLSCLYETIQQFYQVLLEKTRSKQLVLGEGLIEIVQQIGNKRKRIIIELKKHQYTFSQAAMKKQYKKVQHQLREMQKKTKNLQDQLQFYRSKQNIQQSMPEFEMKVIVSAQKYQNILQKLKLLQEQLANLKTAYESSKQQNKQLKEKLEQIQKRIVVIRNNYQSKMQNMDILNQTISVLQQELEKQKKEKKVLTQQLQLKDSQRIVLQNDYRRVTAENKKVQTSLKNKQRQRKRLADLVKKNQEEKDKKVHKFVHIQASHPNSKYFQNKGNVITLVACPKYEGRKRFVHISIPNKISSNFQRISFRINKSLTKQAQMIFGICDSILSPHNSQLCFLRQNFIKYATEPNQISRYCLQNGSGTKYSSESFVYGDTINMQVNLSTKRVQWFKNNKRLMYEHPIKQQLVSVPLYPTIIMCYEGDSVQMIY